MVAPADRGRNQTDGSLHEMTVEILYFDDCPNHKDAQALVERVKDELGVEGETRMVEVTDPDAAERLRFLGSPTVRVDGHDIEPGADERDQYVLACRIYKHDNGFSGLPDEHWLRDALTHGKT
jgi:hypothetical protein